MGGIKDYPSNVQVWGAPYGTEAVFSGPDMLLKLLFKLSHYYPKYTFIARRAENDWIHAFSVKCGDEEIGDVVREWSRGGWAVRLTSTKSLKKDRQKRGGPGFVTTLDDKALKLFKQQFVPKSTDERVTEQMAKVSVEMQTANKLRRELESSYQHVARGLREYVLRNMDKYAPIALQGGTPPSVIEKLPDQIEQVEITGEIEEHHVAGTGTHVVIMDNKYYFKNDCLTFNELSDEIKTQIGMLKMVDDKTFLRDVGLRVDSSVFFLVPYIDLAK